ncbi:pyrokinin-1 receptor isoform X1 [Aedes albopictus]|uniref:G-protein coupled receptors family 1 profile domain-containing protein n=2 Tax=Stegomyia TaxID=53541 RepID=A0ABM1ZU24_AEDAL
MISTNLTNAMKPATMQRVNESFLSVIINSSTSLLDYPSAAVDSSASINFSESEWSVDNSSLFYGPKRDPLYVVIPMTIIYVLIFITGVIGNISTCIVISKNKSMHTATNYYLFSLAISDFLLLISGVPQEIYFIWSKYPYIFGELFCVARGIAAETSANATVLTITAFTIERYVAICHPFLSHTMSKLSRAIRFIFAIWLVAIVSAVPQALQFGVTNQSGVDQCVVKRIIIQHSFELSTFLFFFAPMTLITVLYALIGLKLRSSTLMQRDGTLQRRSNACPNTRQQGTSQGTRRVLKMLVAVVVAFFICWAPFHAQRLVYIYGVDKDHQPNDPLVLKLFVITTYISGILYYLSTCINPLLYNIMSNKFRQAFKETLARGCQISRKSRSKERSYRILSRRERRPTSNKESSEFSGNSIKDDSLYSTSTQKQSINSVALSRGLSVKRFLPDRSAAASAAAECGKAAAIPKMFTSKVMMTSSAHLNLYTQEQELCLNIYPAKDSLSRSTENLSRISIQLNRLSSDETLSHSLQRSHICATPISSSSTSATTQAPTSIIRQATTFAGLSLDDKLNLQQRANSRAQLPRDVTNLDLICSQQGEIKIFIKRKNRHKDNRLKLWRYLHRMSPLKGKQSRHNQHPTAVHFYSPVKYAQRESSEGEHNSKSVSSAANVYPIDFGVPASDGPEDDLEAYMKEIKLRENHNSAAP